MIGATPASDPLLSIIGLDLSHQEAGTQQEAATPVDTGSTPQEQFPKTLWNFTYLLWLVHGKSTEQNNCIIFTQ